MGKNEIKKLLENSKRVLEQDYNNFENTIKSNLNSFKKKTLDKIWSYNSSLYFKYRDLGPQLINEKS